ncbi:hypothetical protein [Adhaeribacter radiodurans]|uniref:Uncharacterized protein n=1 Tax=Adhaeribacter radiodurans TaxID=2745197 RepID=A0A7L7LCK3_9BACT|nr:hypothetical protein [Adhaeribacter radiodurans]QMU30503.1 hypothetical protein HUW48_21865 [Adhaeribacter radiodurans]
MTPPANPLTLSPELIIRLLKEDLKSNKLLLGLNQLGIVAEHYHSDLGSIILILMNLPESDDNLYAFYQNQLTSFTSLETSIFFNQLDALAQKFYQLLIDRIN